MRPLLLLLFAPGLLAAAPPAPDFDRQVAPLLARHCLDCHSGPAPKGKLDLSRRRGAAGVLVPGKPDASDLWTRVESGEMPPKKVLKPEEKKLLRDWIAGGAGWGTDPIDPFRATTDARAGYDWWSLRPLKRPAVPDGAGATPVDRFVRARLAAQGLTPSPAAERRTVIRRLSFDLVGLPPAPEDVESFVADAAPDAYARLVDRLLASPHHGERWARHWLDVVRFGESDGFERDLPRFNAWPYRDWVVSAFNRGLPYDQFIRLQLAGDILAPGDPDALAATGFLVAGAHDIVVPASENMKASMFQDELEDVVGTVGQAFLGLTVACARCHDHKFDPVSQADYYRLAASLGGVRHGERPLPAADGAAILALREREIELSAAIEKLDAPVRARLLASAGAKPGPRPLAEWDFRGGLRDLKGGLHVTLHGGATRGANGLTFDGRTGYATTAPLASALKAKTLEAWVRLDDLAQRGGGVIGVQTPDGNAFDAIVFGEQNPRRWMAGSEFFRRTRDAGGPEEADAGSRPVHVAITYAADGTITLYREGRPYGTAYAAAPSAFEVGVAQVMFGMRHAPAGGNKMLRGSVLRARLYDRALSADEVARSSGSFVAEIDLLMAHGPAGAARRQALLAERAGVAVALRAAEARGARKLYAVNPAAPGPTHLLVRGSVTARGELIAPAPLKAMTGLGPTLPPGAAEADRRRALADWIAHPDNPLTARVIVNRLWHWHFGQGLVGTPSDLGFNGGTASHPELLDWLASELIASGWSLRHVHRLIVLSDTYQQSSRERPEAMKVDAGNRLLWRKSPVRLEAEAVRDAMLSVAGRLDERVGGAPYLDFRTHFFKGTQFYEPVEPTGEALGRRTLYRLWARGGRSPFLDTFDCPDPSTATPARSSTTTPLQALSLFNNAMVLDLAAALAERAARDVGSDPDRQAAQMWQLALGRRPAPREQELIGPFVARHGGAALGRVLFNGNEFMQVD